VRTVPKQGFATMANTVRSLKRKRAADPHFIYGTPSDRRAWIVRSRISRYFLSSLAAKDR
jgi:hypothetical protein